MARLTQVYNPDESYVNIGRRHLPLVAGEKLMMLMDLNSKGLVIDSPQIRGRELEEFTRKFNLLTEEERHKCLEIKSSEFISVLNQCVQCVGCRRRVERLFYQLTLSGHRTLDPLELRQSCTLSITEEKMKTPQRLGTLLYRHHEVLNNLLDSKLRNKTRCILHSLDAFRAKPFSETWREVWSAMKNDCRDELTVIETKELHEVLDNYLKKHKFCTGCRTKIEKAYKILIGEITTKEKGYVSALYANIRKCVADQHIHVSTNKIDFLDALIKRAEPEVNGSYSKLRERHAKTLEIAQEEVLICVGMIMYERLRRIYVSLREEERACQVLAAVGVHALCRSFDTFVEKKQGISNLELLYQEISRAEKAKELRREQRKLKKKKKKNEKKKKNMHRICEIGIETLTDEENVAEADCDDEDIEDNDEDKYDVAVVICDNDNADSYADDEREEHGDELTLRDTTSVGSLYSSADVVVKEQTGLETQPTLLGHVKQTNKKKKQKTMQKQQQVLKKKKKKQKTSKKNKQQQLQQQSQQHQHRNEMQEKQDQCLDIRRISCSSNEIQRSTSDKCNDCLSPTTDCPCEHDVRDSGYGSEPTSHANSRAPSVVSTPISSEVSCSDGLCNHDPEDEIQQLPVNNCALELLLYKQLQQQQSTNTFSLLQMWDDFKNYDTDDENCYIPQEVVLEYQCHREEVQEQRAQLRATLRKNFERLCAKRIVPATSNAQ